MLILFVLGLIFIWWCANENLENINEKYNSWTITWTNTWNIIIHEEIIIDEEQEKKEKIEALRKKLAMRWLILKWDINMENQEYTSALVKYLQILKEIPTDKSTIKKIWDVYFNLQKFKQAYSYYSQIKDYDRLDKDRVVKTLLSFTTITNENLSYINSELESLWLSEEQLFYYQNSITCKFDFSLCKEKFQDYFTEKIKNLELKETKEWTWNIDEILETDKTARFEDLYNIEYALINYENFQIDDLLYKWALVSWAFFENGLYPIAIETSKVLLEQKKDYKPLLKIVAKSYYELWNYIEAKLYLIEYNKLVKEDPDVSYFLWVVYQKLHEYVLSNIHLKKALKIWYTDSLDVNKRILFNYYELWEIEKMLVTMKTIIEENKDKLTVNDFSIFIYYHIVNDEIIDAKWFTELALENFSESPVLNWYYWWILMEEINSKAENIDIIENTDNIENIESIESIEIEENKYAEAEKYISKWLELDTNNPMLNLVKWKLEINKWNISKAFMYFKKTVAVDNNWDFWEIARQELENIQINK